MADFPSRWKWLSLKLCVVALSCCQLTESASIQAGYEFHGDQEFANINGPTPFKRVSTTYLASSPSDYYALALTIETSKTSSPVCYLEIFFFSDTLTNASAAPPPGSRRSYFTYPWTQPCPRKPVPNGNCTFAFTKDGDIQLRNSVAGNSILIWNSNTTGLGATTLEVRDYDILNDSEYDGNLLLLNSSGREVWANERNDSNYSCGGPATSATTKNKASIFTLMCLVLISVLGAGLGRNNQLLLILVCCVLLSSTSESKPIQAGFTTQLQYFNFSNAEAGSVASTSPVAQSPANRTVLELQIYVTICALVGLLISVTTSIILAGSGGRKTEYRHHLQYQGGDQGTYSKVFEVTKGWGPTCLLEVVADRQSTDIVFNASAVNASNTFKYVPWSAPCPRKSAPISGNCTFVFTTEGDIQLFSGSSLVWNSNTAGLGATTLDVLDSDPSATGSIVLYNARNATVWKNVQNMTGLDFQCTNPKPNPNGACSFGSPKLLVMLSTALIIKLLL